MSTLSREAVFATYVVFKRMKRHGTIGPYTDIFSFTADSDVEALISVFGLDVKGMLEEDINKELHEVMAQHLHPESHTQFIAVYNVTRNRVVFSASDADALIEEEPSLACLTSNEGMCDTEMPF